MATMEDLPGEVLLEIFIRLLAKQLAQMRRVCKPWNALLSESSFVKSHLNRSIQNNDEILLIFDGIFSLELSPTPFTARLSRSPDLELTNLIKIPQIKNGCGVVIGSVNGLICFLHGSSCDGAVTFVLHIWNPSLSAVLTLPPCPVNFQQFDYGFGYDPKTHDYKVVKLGSFSRATNMVPQALVYSMRKDSWKLISLQTFPSHVPIHGGCSNHVCVDDNLHWLCETHLESKPQTIVGFDLGEDAFIETPLPETILDFNVYKPFNVLGALGGKLCVISRVRNGKCEVWVMVQYGVVESWVKHHAFSHFSGDIIPYGFTSHGEFLFQVDHDDDRFALYDPVAVKTKTFKIMSKNTFIMKFVEYIDSLVWVPPPNREL